jgi:hypothetical protein
MEADVELQRQTYNQLLNETLPDARPGMEIRYRTSETNDLVRGFRGSHRYSGAETETHLPTSEKSCSRARSGGRGRLLARCAVDKNRPSGRSEISFRVAHDPARRRYHASPTRLADTNPGKTLIADRTVSAAR